MTTLTSTHGPAVGWKWAAAIFATIWFAIIWSIADMGAFQDAPGQPPWSVLVATLTPVALFTGLYRWVASFRQFVLAADLRFVTLVQVSRVIGFVFLGLYGYGLLPGVFAWPAGLGDVLVGIAAAFTAYALIVRPAFATSRRFTAFHVLGLFDFVVAFATATLGAGVFPGIVGAVTSAPVGTLPLVLLPAFLVPIYIMLHLTALLQVRELRGHAVRH